MAHFLDGTSEDRPGLVRLLAEAVSQNGGNWLESSMSQLAGKFAGILRVSVSKDHVDALVAALNKMADHAALPYGVSGRDFNDWRMNDLDTFVEALVATDGIDVASSDTQHRMIVRDVRAVVAKIFGVTPSSA